jgi:hypothetical protein
VLHVAPNRSYEHERLINDINVGMCSTLLNLSAGAPANHRRASAGELIDHERRPGNKSEEVAALGPLATRYGRAASNCGEAQC